MPRAVTSRAVLPTVSRLFRAGGAAAVLLLAACGSSTYLVNIRTEPQSCDIYVNGRHVGRGPEKTVEFDFAEGERVFLQVSAPGMRPSFDVFTETTLPENLEKRVTLTR